MGGPDLTDDPDRARRPRGGHARPPRDHPRTRPTPRPTISLCIVARNEEGFIKGCIASASALADEILVLDTGSTDLTRHLAKEAGARIVRARWRDDYARAFEQMRQAARGDWILNLDADEALDPAAHDRVRTLVAAPEADGYLPLIRNYCYQVTVKWRAADASAPTSLGACGWSPSRTVRLFRNDPRYCYTGAVHHTVAPSVLAAGGSIAPVDIVIHHWGRLRLDQAAVKPAHYGTLTERKVGESPDSGRAWVELGVVLDHQGHLEEALDAFLRARTCGYGAGALFHSGRTRYQAGDCAGAVAAFEAALREDPRDDDVDFDRADALELLGVAHEGLGRAAPAEDCYRAALASRPDSPAAANNLADLLARAGRPDEAAPLIAALVEKYPGFDMVRGTLGNVRSAAGDDRGAERAYRAALSMNPENLPARVNLAGLLARTGRPAAAARGYRLAAERVPEHGPASALARYMPRRTRRPARVTAPPGPAPLLVSLVSLLGGGAGRVVLDLVRALGGYRHVVLCADPGAYDGLGYRRELRAVGAGVHRVADSDAALEIVARLAPAALLNHWWPTARFAALTASCPVPQILIGHATMRMPPGPDAYVVLSEFQRRTQGHLPAGRVHLIPNATRLDVPGGRLDGARGRVRIAMLTRLDVGKFPRRLLHYLPDLAACRAELVIAGRGPRRYEIEPELGEVFWGGRVRFRGTVPAARAAALLATAGVGLHLTETSMETCSLSVIEMLAAGLPVVSQPRGCLPEMVVDGENGFLADTEAEIAGRLEELLLDAALRRRMGAASRDRARHYDLRRFAASYRRLVESVIS